MVRLDYVRIRSRQLLIEIFHPLQLFVAYCVGNVIGPQLFMADEAPVYQTGFLSIMICYAIGICSCFALRIYLIWCNNTRTHLAEANVDQTDVGFVNIFADKTDKEEMSFRYVY